MQLGGPQLYRPSHKPHQGTLLCYQAQGLRAAPSPRASMTFLSGYILITLSRVWPLLSVLLYSRPSLVSQSSISPKIASLAYWASHVLLHVFTVFLACYLKSHCSHTTDCLYYSNSHNIVSHLATFSQINWKLSQSPIALEKAMITNETNLAQLSSFWHPLLAVTD